MKRLLVVVMLLGAMPPDVARSESPAVVFALDVPQDVRDLALGTWQRFRRSFPARHRCVGPVAVAVARDLGDRAEYDPTTRRVTVRIPGTAPNLSASLVHEFAHHLEFTCPAHLALRPTFLSAQGFPPGAPWFEGATWEETPSEHYAEAVVEVVLGFAHAHARIPISPWAIAVVRAWGRGD